MAVAPKTLTVRCYGVGFGDCFLLTFHYAGATGDRHVLIDFGSTQKPPRPRKKLMTEVAKDIARVVGKPLHVLVATHRHADHINGFATNKNGTAPGDIIASLEPQLVIQPWTERPGAPREFKGVAPGPSAANDTLRMALLDMAGVATVSLREARGLPAAAARQVRFIAVDGLSNLSAVKNLAKMGKRTRAAYVQHGSRIPELRTLLPGVKVTVLGPPTIRQKSDIGTEKRGEFREYWNFGRFWGLRAATAAMVDTAGVPFPDAGVYSARTIPAENRWFVRRLKALRGEQLLRLVRAMDDTLNNTSVILLIEAGSKKLVFSGDAQWENWEFALDKDKERLTDVDVYKVGHHGSLNATPRTLWSGFAKASEKATDPHRLHTLMSTRSDSKHGHRESRTEVPRDTLVDALKKSSRLHSTQQLEDSGDLVLPVEFDLG